MRAKHEDYDNIYFDMPPSTTAITDGIAIGDRIIKVNDGVSVTVKTDNDGEPYIEWDSYRDWVRDKAINALKTVLPGPRGEPSGIKDRDQFIQRFTDWRELDVAMRGNPIECRR